MPRVAEIRLHWVACISSHINIVLKLPELFSFLLTPIVFVSVSDSVPSKPPRSKFRAFSTFFI